MRIINLSVLITMLITISCVPARQFQVEKERRERCEKDYQIIKSSYDNLKIENEELLAKLNTLNKQLEALKRDTLLTNNSMRMLHAQYDKINELYEVLLKRNRELLEGNVAETQKISSELQLTYSKLQQKEDELKKLEIELNNKEKNLNLLAAQLSDKEKRIDELENILKQKDKAVKDLRDKVANALLGFESSGLTVEIKNGKVYVSLEESLLFPTASWTVNPKGKDALKRIAGVLESSPDVNILIEGHTDNVPYRGSGQIKDNWDLSVMRATAIVKILIENSNINPKRLVTAGRSEYDPIDKSDTPEARQKNRRTEIILTPKLDELFKILDMKF